MSRKLYSSTVAENPTKQDEAKDRPLVAIFLLLSAMAIVPAMDACAKWLSAEFDVLQITWARYFFHMMAILPLVVWRHGLRNLWPARPALQLVRSGFLFGSTVFFFAAIARMPMADALAMVFVSPLIVTALSPWLLGEHVGPRRWGAVAVGFLGTCIIVRPDLSGSTTLQGGALFALSAGCLYALYTLSTRKLSGSAPPLVTLTFTSLTGAVIMTAIVPFVWKTPDAQAWLLMVIMGLIAAGGHYLIILAFERAPASLLAPFGYSEIVWTALLGYVIFGNFPDSWTWLGIAVVVACGIYISLREAKRQPQAKPTPNQPL
ncbi:MAG: DMT family transporter [Pseudomonadota bacterium]